MAEQRIILSGDEAVAEAALACGVKLGTGYPGTPSTEILEHFSAIGGNAEWRRMKKWQWKSPPESRFPVQKRLLQ